MNKSFWKNKRVFITGHTGFKGSWLCLWLSSLGAVVKGYALDPPTVPSLYEICGIKELVESHIADIRDVDQLKVSLLSFKPDIVIHMAAQPLVRDSYRIPVETYSINVMGAVHLLESVRLCHSVRSVVNVTTDKCYENNEWIWGYRENEPMGGYDPYSNSKACSELVTSSYRNSFFNSNRYGKDHYTAVASARAGNVIGGGDWADDRLIPDLIRQFLKRETVLIRNPHAVRPWQHVLEPLSGYMVLAEKLFVDGPDYASAWNFGPEDCDAQPVEYIVKKMCELWGDDSDYIVDNREHPHEATYLKLDCSKAKKILGWSPCWNLDTALVKIVEWTKTYKDSVGLRDVCLTQIEEYESKRTGISK